MDQEEREQYEENRKHLLEIASMVYHIGSTINEDDEIILTGDLAEIFQFSSDYRSEIEEML